MRGTIGAEQKPLSDVSFLGPTISGQQLEKDTRRPPDRPLRAWQAPPQWKAGFVKIEGLGLWGSLPLTMVLAITNIVAPRLGRSRRHSPGATFPWTNGILGKRHRVAP